MCMRRAKWPGSLLAEGRSGVIVTVLCDGATKYLSEPFWNDTKTDIMINVEKAAWDVMVAHAESKFPNECCGAMIGQDQTTT